MQFVLIKKFDLNGKNLIFFAFFDAFSEKSDRERRKSLRFCIDGFKKKYNENKRDSPKREGGGLCTVSDDIFS